MAAWVLIVDDDADNRELLAELLESAGFTAVASASAQEAGRLLDRKGRPSLVISDIRLPDVDGPSFVESMRSRAGFAAVPVVFVTGTNPDRMSALTDPVLVKPVDIEVLVTLVSRHYIESVSAMSL